MSKEAKIRLIKYTSAAAFVGIMAYFYIAARDFIGASLVVQCWVLCDALTIPGTLLLMVGCLVWVSNLGALDGIAYALSFAVRSLIPGMRGKRDEKYADYVERRREKPVRGYGFLLISGGITLGIALVFMAMFFALS